MLTRLRQIHSISNLRAFQPHVASIACAGNLYNAPGTGPALGCRQRSDLTPAGDSLTVVGKNLLVDTFDLFKRFEKAGLSPRQAELISKEILELVCVAKEKINDSCATKAALRESILEQEVKIASFKSEVLKSQELSAATFLRETERLQSSLDKIKVEVRYEIDKLTASQRLDLNLEKGRMRDELQALRDKANELEIKLDKEINGLKAMVELTKNETVKYLLATMLGLFGIGLGVARLVM